MITLDPTDHNILRTLQKDCSLALEEIGSQVGLSRNACWRRVRAMEEAGVIRRRVALLEPESLGLPLQVFVMVRTSSHTTGWSEKFRSAVQSLPEIQGAYRMSGDLDYLIRARVSSMSAYDNLYQRLIEKVALSDVSASFVMEELKDTTELPL